MMSTTMYTVVLVAWLFIGTSFGYDRRISVDYDTCGNTYYLNDDDDLIYLTYHGASIPRSCRITIKANDGLSNICTYPENFDLDSCSLSIEYHGGSFSSFNPDRKYTCSALQYGEYCSPWSTLIIAFDTLGSSNGYDNIEIKVSMKDDEIVSDIIDASKTVVYVVVGVVVGVIVILIVLIVVVVICCCKRRGSQSGTVYRSPAQAGAVTTTAGYPMATQPGYQVQTGYTQPGFQHPPPQQGGFQQPPPPGGFQQPPPPGGFQQPPPPGGFQQPPPPGGFQQSSPAGYPSQPQQGYAGPNAPFNEKASAPPMDPPPYS